MFKLHFDCDGFLCVLFTCPICQSDINLFCKSKFPLFAIIQIVQKKVTTGLSAS